MADPVPVLTIDGPSGSGKGTVSRLAAARLGWHYLDSGALYRAVGAAAARGGLDQADVEAMARLTRDTRIEFREHPDGQVRELVDGEDARGAARTVVSGTA